MTGAAGRTLADAMAVRLRADAEVAGASEALPGGLTQLHSAAFPVSHDLNALWVPAGADQAAVDAAAARRPARVTVPVPAAGLTAPDGWRLDEQAVHLAGPDVPAWPRDVVGVTPHDLHAARLQVWRGLVPDAAAATRLAEMQIALGSHPQARTLAVLEDAEPVAWVAVIAGAIDDVWVQPAHRGRGLGRAVTRAALAAGGWFLVVDLDNAPALALYAAEGFVAAGRLVVLSPA